MSTAHLIPDFLCVCVCLLAFSSFPSIVPVRFLGQGMQEVAHFSEFFCLGDVSLFLITTGFLFGWVLPQLASINRLNHKWISLPQMLLHTVTWTALIGSWLLSETTQARPPSAFLSFKFPQLNSQMLLQSFPQPTRQVYHCKIPLSGISFVPVCFCCCDKTPCPKARWEGKDLFKLIGFGPTSSEAKAETQGKNLEAETEAETTGGHDSLACSVHFLKIQWYTCYVCSFIRVHKVNFRIYDFSLPQSHGWW